MLSVYSRQYPPRPSNDQSQALPLSGSMVSWDRTGHSFAGVRRLGGRERAEEFKRELESEYESKENGGPESLDVTPERRHAGMARSKSYRIMCGVRCRRKEPSGRRRRIENAVMPRELPGVRVRVWQPSSPSQRANWPSSYA